QHRTPKQATARGEDKLRLCARNWVAEADAIETGFETIEPTRVLELQYEQLLAEPLVEMRRVLDFVGLPSSSAYEDAITQLGLVARPSTWQTTWTAEQTAMVNREQKQQLARQGYAQ
ncbi:MAG: sulfotransferase, partial [Woeseia sp.]